MVAGDLISTDYQYEYNGLLIGADTDYHVQELSGLSGFPTVRDSGADRFGRHGAVGGRHYLPKRVFTILFDITPVNDDIFADQRDAIQLAFGVRTDPQSELPFIFRHPGRDKLRVDSRPTALDVPINRLYALKFPQITVRFEATNPMLVDNVANLTSIQAAVDTTGLVFPIDFPLNFGPSSTNALTVTNSGTAPAFWSATIIGPCVDPVLEDSYSGHQLRFSGLEIFTGETLIMNSLNRTALLNGTASRRHLLTSTSRWFQLPPRITTSIRYTVGSTTGTTSCNFEWRNTYWSD